MQRSGEVCDVLGTRLNFGVTRPGGRAPDPLRSIAVRH